MQHSTRLVDAYRFITGITGVREYYRSTLDGSMKMIVETDNGPEVVGVDEMIVEVAA